MVDPEAQMAALETQWRETDDLLKAARAELVIHDGAPAEQIAPVRKRIERAERMKQKIMQKIMALEEDMDSAQSG